MPYSSAREFVGRKGELAKVHQALHVSEQVAVTAIAGMGGIGKTELALRYGMQYRGIYPGGVCWLNVREADLGTQIVQFAEDYLQLTMPAARDLLGQVQYCWANWSAGSVLLVYDDVPDYGVLRGYLPPAQSRFKVLVTSRRRPGANMQSIDLDVLDPEVALLVSLVGEARINAEQEVAEQLCDRLGYLPLGLTLVGRYLANGLDLSVAEVLEELGEQSVPAEALLRDEADLYAPLGVLEAFELSWGRLSAVGQELGCRLSLFAEAEIPWGLVEQLFAAEEVTKIRRVRDKELMQRSLLQRTEQDVYRLHPLVRAFFRVKLAELATADDYRREFCRVMAAVAGKIPYKPTKEQVEQVRPAIPHRTYAKVSLSLKHELY